MDVDECRPPHIDLCGEARYAEFMKSIERDVDYVTFEGDSYHTFDVLQVMASNSKLESLHVITSTFGKLVYLNASFNKLSDIRCISDLTCLEVLDVSSIIASFSSFSLSSSILFPRFLFWFLLSLRSYLSAYLKKATNT